MEDIRTIREQERLINYYEECLNINLEKLDRDDQEILPDIMKVDLVGLKRSISMYTDLIAKIIVNHGYKKFYNSKLIEAVNLQFANELCIESPRDKTNFNDKIMLAIGANVDVLHCSEDEFKKRDFFLNTKIQNVINFIDEKTNISLLKY